MICGSRYYFPHIDNMQLLPRSNAIYAICTSSEPSAYECSKRVVALPKKLYRLVLINTVLRSPDTCPFVSGILILVVLTPDSPLIGNRRCLNMPPYIRERQETRKPSSRVLSRPQVE